MDFVHATLAGARTIRILTLLDVHTRECLALVPQPAFRGADVARILGETGTARGLPRMISVDDGAEFTSKALDQWAYWNHVTLDSADRASRPTTRTSRCSTARFGGSAGLRPPAQHWFTSLADAEQRLRAWQSEYNNSRPHSSLEQHPPAHRGIGRYFIPGRNSLRD
jgi:putative transposase